MRRSLGNKRHCCGHLQKIPSAMMTVWSSRWGQRSGVMVSSTGFYPCCLSLGALLTPGPRILQQLQTFLLSWSCCLQYHQFNSSNTQFPEHRGNKNKNKNTSTFMVMSCGREIQARTETPSCNHKSLNSSPLPTLTELGPPSLTALASPCPSQTVLWSTLWLVSQWTSQRALENRVGVSFHVCTSRPNPN